ncbi:MAG: glycine--tRNA ligase [Bacteroidetes bacterium HLUCCA01]|nr:MAG: glycine--tRNA ligase [Bacteroidetes bacterium HLUCCA01]
MSELKSLEKIVSLSKARGFIFQSSEIYGGLASVYDYAPLGVELKRKLNQAWWRSMTQKHSNIVGIDAAILMHPKVWKASGHVDSFNDPMIDDKASKMRYRADHIIEGHIARLTEKGKQDEADRIQQALDTAGSRKSLAEDLYDIIMAEEIKSPDSGAFDWTEVRQFNLMFSTKFGATAQGEDSTVYLRPETAQGIFVNFLNVLNTSRVAVPFGIAQIGKAFRNEVVARQFVFRMREFEQMEMQFFVKPGTDMEQYEAWKEERMNWHKSIGIRPENLRFADHPQDKLAHYAKAAVDIQYKFPIGWQELEGIHNRTDFDLSQHQEFSGKKLEYFDPQSQERYIPYVIETSVGLDRTTLMVLCDAYREEVVAGEKEGTQETRTVLKMHPKLAPVTAGIFPLIKKPELVELARKLENELSDDYKVLFDEKGSIGKRYRRLDEAGTPFCLTVDFDTLEDQAITIRDRDSMTQERIPLERAGDVIKDRMKNWTPPA